MVTENNLVKSMPIFLFGLMIYAFMFIANYVDETLGNTSGFWLQIGKILFGSFIILFVSCFVILTVSDYLNSKKVASDS